MCKMASFLYKRLDNNDVELCFHDLESHGNTQSRYPEHTEAEGWFEGHYTPEGELELRCPKYNRDAAAETRIRRLYPTFDVFIWSMFRNGDLPYSQNAAILTVLRNHNIS